MHSFGLARYGQKKDLSTAECLACHNDPTLTKEVNGKSVSLYVKEESFKTSMHGAMFQCADCHQDIKAVPHEPAPAKVSCGSCHTDAQQAYDKGYHAKAIRDGNRNAATCVDCHGNAHELLAAGDPNSKVAHANIPKTCGSCHGQKFVMEGSGHSAQPFFSYQEGVHGRAVAAGSAKAAVCTDCHGTHEILAAGNPKSSIFKFNVPATCAKCHDSVKSEFMQHPWGGDYAGQLAGAGLHRLPRNPPDPPAYRPDLLGSGATVGQDHLRTLP